MSENSQPPIRLNEIHTSPEQALAEVYNNAGRLRSAITGLIISTGIFTATQGLRPTIALGSMYFLKVTMYDLLADIHYAGKPYSNYSNYAVNIPVPDLPTPNKTKLTALGRIEYRLVRNKFQKYQSKYQKKIDTAEGKRLNKIGGNDIVEKVFIGTSKK